MIAKSRVAAMVLVTLGALALGLLGADAAGLDTGGRRLPLVNGGANAQVPPPTNTPTATATSTPVPPLGGTSIELLTLPDEIVCDGLHTTRLRVRLLDGSGRAVKDGTPVYFSTLQRPGFVDPPIATTYGGIVWANAGAYPQPQSPYRPFAVEVDTGRIQATIRIFCLPEGAVPCETPASPPQVSPPDPSSPPQNPPAVSPPGPPPCPPPESPPESPPGCVEPASPPQSVSPPCPTATPTPDLSACIAFGTPACDTPTPSPCGLTSPPFGTPPCDTPTPSPCETNEAFSPPCQPGGGIFFAVDCDLNEAGIQSECDVPLGSPSLDVGVVVGNEGDLSYQLAAFNFVLHDPDTSRLQPPPGADFNLNSNPDLDESQMIGPWQCNPPPPSNDTGQDGPGAAASFLSCFNAADPPNLPTLGHGSLRLAIVHYAVPAQAAPGSLELSLSDMSVADTSATDLGFCPPDFGMVVPCLPATVHFVQPPATATPTVTPTSSPTAIPTTGCTGDVNGDGKVNTTDLLGVMQHMRQRNASSRYDVNHDGKVDTTDLLIVIKNFGKTCP